MDVSNDKKYTLPPEEHEKIRQRIVRNELAESVATDKPRAIILAGQPGAGKSGVKKAAENELAPKGGVVVVDTDELRVRYRNRKENVTYRQLSEANDRAAAGLVQKDAGQWADELTQDAITYRRNVIIDGTLKNKENTEKLCEELKHQGYEIDVRVMAVAKEDSMQMVYARYEGPKVTKGEPGRWVADTVHNEAYEGLAASIDAIDRGRLADQIGVYKRGIDRYSPPVLIHTGHGAVDALKAERNRERTPKELNARHEVWNRQAKSPKDAGAGIMQRIRARDPALSEPENRRAAELAAEARDKARNAAMKETATPWTKHSTLAKESGGPWTKHSTSTKDSAEAWTKHSTSTKDAAGPWTKHSTSPQQEKAGGKDQAKGR